MGRISVDDRFALNDAGDVSRRNNAAFEVARQKIDMALHITHQAVNLVGRTINQNLIG
jgi:hypothetical protein